MPRAPEMNVAQLSRIAGISARGPPYHKNRSSYATMPRFSIAMYSS